LANQGLVFTKNTLGPGLASFPAKVRRGVVATVRREAPISESYMKRNAPWTDRTGNARSGLNARSEHKATSDAVVLAHGVSYGFWLEVIQGGEWAIIVPTLPVRGPAMMRTLTKLFARL
jgi:hypothetical protein